MRECLADSTEVCDLLKRYGIALEDIVDYHRYPIADNDSPALSADRLEYTMGNLLNYGFAPLGTIREMYEDLIVGTDEMGRPEVVFRTPEIAAKFTRLALLNSHVYVADEDRFAMEALAGILRGAIERQVLRRDDLMTIEPKVISKLEADAVCAKEWHRFCGYSGLLRAKERPESGDWICVDAKKRWIDPLVTGRGRVSAWDPTVAQEMNVFCTLDFSHWMCGK